MGGHAVQAPPNVDLAVPFFGHCCMSLEPSIQGLLDVLELVAPNP